MEQFLGWVSHIISNFALPKKSFPADPTDKAVLESLPDIPPSHLVDPASMPSSAAGHRTLVKQQKATAAASKKKQGTRSYSRIYFLNGAPSKHVFLLTITSYYLIEP